MPAQISFFSTSFHTHGHIRRSAFVFMFLVGPGNAASRRAQNACCLSSNCSIVLDKCWDLPTVGITVKGSGPTTAPSV